MDFRIRVAELFGTVFYIGKIPFAPGTWGSIAALIAQYILKPYWIDPLFLLITGVFFFLGIVITHVLVEFWKEKDPLKRLNEYYDQSEILEITNEINNEISLAHSFADSSAFPTYDDLLEISKT